MCCRGAGGSPARRQESKKQAKMPMFSVISRQPWTPLPGGGHPAAPWRMAGGRMAHAKAAKGARGEREGKKPALGEGRLSAEAGKYLAGGYFQP